MTQFEKIKAMNLEQLAELFTEVQIMVVVTTFKRLGIIAGVAEDEESKMFEEMKMFLESEVPSND